MCDARRALLLNSYSIMLRCLSIVIVELCQHLNADIVPIKSLYFGAGSEHLVEILSKIHFIIGITYFTPKGSQ